MRLILTCLLLGFFFQISANSAINFSADSWNFDISNSDIYINEVVSDNANSIADNEDEYDDWIEIYNSGNTPINLADYYISDNNSDLQKWKIPDTNETLTTVPAKGYLILWADDDTEQGENHLNFKLSNGGEQIILTAPDGETVIDEISFPELIADTGYGRLPDGSSILSELRPVSPLASNNNSRPQAMKPSIFPESGQYSDVQTISISAENGASIYYTTDGSEPTILSNLYNNPFPVDSVVSVRAIAVKADLEPSFVTTNTYLINFNSALPVFHISMNPEDLYDDSKGIYVTGTNGISGYCSGSTKRNWNQDWEKEAHLKVFKMEKSLQKII